MNSPKSFLVTITPGESTRWLCDDSRLARAMQIVASTTTKIFTSGAEPLVHVQFLPGGSVPAAAPLVACDDKACASPDPESPGAFCPPQQVCFCCGAALAGNSPIQVRDGRWFCGYNCLAALPSAQL